MIGGKCFRCGEQITDPKFPFSPPWEVHHSDSTSVCWGNWLLLASFSFSDLPWGPDLYTSCVLVLPLLVFLIFQQDSVPEMCPPTRVGVPGGEKGASQHRRACCKIRGGSEAASSLFAVQLDEVKRGHTGMDRKRAQHPFWEMKCLSRKKKKKKCHKKHLMVHFWKTCLPRDTHIHVLCPAC